MKVIGIVGRVYYNRDNQEIIQLNDFIRRVLSIYKEIVSIILLPTNNISYLNINMGSDDIAGEDSERLDYILDKCDGFIIPGGSSWYKFDEYVIGHAMKNNKPLLGICAGFQAICSMFAIDRNNFDMTKNFDNYNHYGEYNKYRHEINIMDNTLLRGILNKDKIMVNSLHHDYIEFPMRELVVSAISIDNIIEAVELPGHPFFVGIQWHPEYLMDSYSKNIFDYFIKSIKRS